MGAAANRWSNLAIVRASSGKRLWLGAAGVAVFIATVWTAHAMTSRQETREPGFGLDFIAFYTAGTFEREGRLGDLYNLQAVHQFQRELASANQFDIGHAYGPWWNPPFYGLVFSPLSRLPYPAAAGAWITFNLLCFAGACVLLCRLMPSSTSQSATRQAELSPSPGNPGEGWQGGSRERALVPVLIVLSAPFILAVSHAQNTCTSLLLLTVTVTLWRARRPLLAGLVGGLMFYKPQVAAVLAAVLLVDLGWRALAGYAVTGTALLLTNLVALPGTLSDYLHRLPVNLHDFQTGTLYPWEQHVTFNAFWRLLIQGHSLGDMSVLATSLTYVSMLAVGTLLLLACLRTRKMESARDRDRLIAATIAAAPLLMPFYFDYDLLLLAVPAVLFASECMRRAPGHPLDSSCRWLVAAWSALYVWQMVNTDVGARFHVNLAVPLLATVASLMIARVARAEPQTAQTSAPAERPVREAA
jgi:alpha-1,2-mannosyltransferase